VRGYRILAQNLAKCVKERSVFDLQHLAVAEYTLQRLLDAKHRLMVVSMRMVTVFVHPRISIAALTLKDACAPLPQASRLSPALILQRLVALVLCCGVFEMRS
jgi:hypothetical protein